MKKLSLLVLFVISLMLITGCDNSTETGTVDGTPFIGGTTGLVASFADGNPPSEIYDNGNYPFNIDVILKNMGEYTIPSDSVTIKIQRIFPGDFGKTSGDLIKNADSDLLAKRKDTTGRIIEGTTTHVLFDGLNYGGSIIGSMSSINFNADVCYSYQTTANTKVCVREKMTDYTDGVCKVDGLKTVYNSGAPIHVENLDEEPLSNDKFRITFDVVHSSIGKVYRLDSDCSDEFADKNYVDVIVDTGLSGDVSCTGFLGSSSNQGTVRLSDDTSKATVACTQTVDESEKGEFEKGIVITLNYNYNTDVSKEIVLKHAGE